MRKVEVRIAVAVDEAGKWNAAGWCEVKPNEAMDMALDAFFEGDRSIAQYWVTAELEVPETAEVAGKVKPA